MDKSKNSGESTDLRPSLPHLASPPHGRGMVPLNGALCRLLSKFLLGFSLLSLLLWSFSQRNQSATELEHLQRRFRFAQDQLDSLHAQIDVITRHKGKVEHLLEKAKEQFERKSKDQARRITQLEAENTRLGKALSRLSAGKHTGQKPYDQSKPADDALSLVKQTQFRDTVEKQRPNNFGNDSKAIFGMQEAEEDPFIGEDNGKHQIRAPLIPPEAKDEEMEEKGEEDGKEEKMGEKEEREDVGAEKDYVFERERPREELVFRRGNGTEGGGGQHQEVMSGRELMRKLKQREEEEGERRRKRVENTGEGEEVGLVRADG